MALAAETDPSDGCDKRPGAFRTISEVADELDVPQHVLRFWETRFVQIKPVKRAGGRRYYRPEDVDLLRGVRRLLHDQGYTIKGAQRVFKESGVRFVQSVGRGEAIIAAAPIGEVEEADTEAVEDGIDPSDGREPERSDIATLEGVLRDLYACRSALDASRRARADIPLIPET